MLAKISSKHYNQIGSYQKFFSSWSYSAAISNFEPNVSLPYNKLLDNLSIIRKKLNRPLSLSEKILYSHLDDPECVSNIKRNESFISLNPDRLAMPDSSSQIALLQFISTGMSKVNLPSTIHCDHLIEAHCNAKQDLQEANIKNIEINNFLISASKKYGIGFWKPNSGIIHQIVLENYAFPGGFMIGTDSHTPNAGGLSMCGIGVGAPDALDCMVGYPLQLKAPKIIGIKLNGKLSKWCSPKMIILKVAQLLTVQGGTGAIIEYFGDKQTLDTISCTGMATICNMGAEIGATCSVFQYNESMKEYLNATGREYISNILNKDLINQLLKLDEKFDPKSQYDEFYEINLSKLKPSMNGPYTPDLRHNLGEDLSKEVNKNGWPKNLSASLIGSCTNSSYEDLSRVAFYIKQASNAGLKAVCPLYVSPGSEQIRATMKRDGLQDIFESVGATILGNSCGPCIGQWKREKSQFYDPNKPNSIITSFNRNFAKRNDGNSLTHSFVTSPEICAMLSFSGDITFDPTKDKLKTENGEEFMFKPPTDNDVEFLPKNGFDTSSLNDIYQEPIKNENEASKIEIDIDPTSERIQLYPIFNSLYNNGKDIENGIILIKTRGKCTTDHISLLGPWMKYRGHLDNMSNNCLIGAINDENGKENSIYNVLNDTSDNAVPETAKKYKENKIPWIVIGCDNYGEGSSRETAATVVRNLGGYAVIAKSFARIHETNLKKFGMLALTFDDKSDYDLIQTGDKISIVGINEFKPNKSLQLKVIKRENNKEIKKKIILNHTYNDEQIEWFKYGSSLNYIKQKQKLCEK